MKVWKVKTSFRALKKLYVDEQNAYQNTEEVKLEKRIKQKI